MQNMKGMEELVNQAFAGVEGLGPEVVAGQYGFIRGDGEIILPQVWESVVRPDSEISMRMWHAVNQNSARKENGTKAIRLKGGFGKMFDRRSGSKDGE